MKLLAKRTQLNLLRKLIGPYQGIDFASSDYLGFARSEKLKHSILERCAKIDWSGSYGSRLLGGNHPFYETLEKKIAAFHHASSSLLFSSGYAANIGLISAITEEKDYIFFDQEIHASTRDGIRLSPATSYPFFHNDLNHLEKRLKHKTGNLFILTESLFSVDGSLAPLDDLLCLSKKYGAYLIVDEAHATGIFGHKGEGLCTHSETFARVYTYGKAFGLSGAAVVGSPQLREILINRAHSLIYTAAHPTLFLSAIDAAYDFAQNASYERATLKNLWTRWHLKSPIKQIIIGDTLMTKEIGQKLQEKGIGAGVLLSPTVRNSKASLRISLHSFNTHDELYFLQQTLQEVL